MRCFIVSLTWQPHTQPLLCFPSSIWQAPVLETPATSLDGMQVPILARVLQEEFSRSTGSQIIQASHSR